MKYYEREETKYGEPGSRVVCLCETTNGISKPFIKTFKDTKGYPFYAARVSITGVLKERINTETFKIQSWSI